MICEQWDVVVVPFPFVENPKAKPRPVVVLSNEYFYTANDHFIAAMITTAAQTQWSGDTVITNLKNAGLRHYSVIRLKLFTFDRRIKVRKIGVLSVKDRACFQKNFKTHIPIF